MQERIATTDPRGLLRLEDHLDLLLICMEKPGDPDTSLFDPEMSVPEKHTLVSQALFLMNDELALRTAHFIVQFCTPPKHQILPAMFATAHMLKQLRAKVSLPQMC